MDAELVSLVSDIVVGLCAIAVAIVAVFGLRTWRKELKKKSIQPKMTIFSNALMKLQTNWVPP